MSGRIKRVTSLALAGGIAGLMLAATAAPADAALILARKCPAGYYGVEVYDGNGNLITWACVVDPL